MHVATWTLGIYIGIGVFWLIAMLVLAQREYQWVSPKEAMLHLLAWPFVFVAMRLWGVAFVAVAFIGLTAVSAFVPDTLLAELIGAVWRAS